MARMVPPELGIGPRGQDAESSIFDLIEDQTPDGWVGLHHVGHPASPDQADRRDRLHRDRQSRACFVSRSRAAPLDERTASGTQGPRELKESPFPRSAARRRRCATRFPTLHPFVVRLRLRISPLSVRSRRARGPARGRLRRADARTTGSAAYIEALGKYWAAGIRTPGHSVQTTSARSLMLFGTTSRRSSR